MVLKSLEDYTISELQDGGRRPFREQRREVVRIWNDCCAHGERTSGAGTIPNGNTALALVRLIENFRYRRVPLIVIRWYRPPIERAYTTPQSLVSNNGVRLSRPDQAKLREHYLSASTTKAKRRSSHDRHIVRLPGRERNRHGRARIWTTTNQTTQRNRPHRDRGALRCRRNVARAR